MAKNAPPKPTPESLAISRALKARGKGSAAALADRLGLTPSVVSQWATARRPVPADLAPAVADFLGLTPEGVSTAYARIPLRVGEPSGTYAKHLPPNVQRAPDDIHALNLALGALVATMVRHRPAEAAAYAAALRKNTPPALRDVGLIRELLTTLAAVGSPANRAGK